MVAATPYYFCVFVTMIAFFVFVMKLTFSSDEKTKSAKGAKKEADDKEKQKKE